MDLAALTAILVRVFLVVTMIAIGMGLRGDRVSDVRPGGLVGLGIVNLLLVPVVAVLVCRAFALEAPVAIAVLAMAVAPAGSLGPKLVQVARGDLALGVMATFGLSAVATLTVAPSLAVTAAAVGLDTTAQPVDAALVIGALAIFQLAPLLAGLVIAARRPDAAATIARPLTRLSTILLVAIVVLVLVDGWAAVLALGPTALLAILTLIAAADILGWLAGGRSPAGRRTSAILTGQRSGALALLVVGGPGAPVESATIVAFALLLLVVNAAFAGVAGRTVAGPSWRGATA